MEVINTFQLTLEITINTLSLTPCKKQQSIRILLNRLLKELENVFSIRNLLHWEATLLTWKQPFISINPMEEFFKIAGFHFNVFLSHCLAQIDLFKGHFYFIDLVYRLFILRHIYFRKSFEKWKYFHRHTHTKAKKSE